MDLGDYMKFICNTCKIYCKEIYNTNTSEQINMCDYCFYTSKIRRRYYAMCLL